MMHVLDGSEPTGRPRSVRGSQISVKFLEKGVQLKGIMNVGCLVKGSRVEVQVQGQGQGQGSGDLVRCLEVE